MQAPAFADTEREGAGNQADGSSENVQNQRDPHASPSFQQSRLQ